MRNLESNKFVMLVTLEVEFTKTKLELHFELSYTQLI